jgi:hypothetical protein
MFGEDTPDADTPETSEALVGEAGHAATPTADRIAFTHALRSAGVSALRRRIDLSRNLITNTELPFSCLSAAPSNDNSLRVASPSCAVYPDVEKRMTMTLWSSLYQAIHRWRFLG